MAAAVAAAAAARVPQLFCSLPANQMPRLIQLSGKIM